ncbi:SprT-like family protein [Peptoniphilus asaccharolyticus DSM 20463]|uniref:SprT-like family protein n=1 Tax=Peptoniphilus asaccharolyticus DSM 20463 TaxID=573058 RepID=A0A1W1V3Z1_PEPAS|nr:SprT-like domain-containing protein [Peptoniphilus asaccharolyticus]MBL7576259.1 SprT-like domain-containing protein [Peptoniphilus asaccharolyticus]CRH92175.1 SprT-like family [Chlamydia trachomatis]SMB88015.1 SprT-like family protein [Peptoniphilus asaccharolyticus DSM 20463]
MYITQKIADETLLKVKSEIEQLGIQVGKIKPSVKLTSNKTTLGTCNKLNNSDFDFEIRITKYIANEQALKNTIAHEILHSVKGCFNHQKKWKAMAEKVNSKYGYNITRLGDISEANVKPKYIVVCKNCGLEYKYFKKGKVIKYLEANSKNIKCGKCRGELELIRT